MLVISFKLIGVFLGLYLSGVSATPTGVSRNPRELVPRATPEINLCLNTDPWVVRECMRDFGPRAWADLCWSHHSRPPYEYRRLAECPEDTYCENIEEDGEDTIKCLHQPDPDTTAPSNSPKDPQIGASAILIAPAGIGATQFDFSVKILNSIKASVTAFVISEDRDFIVTPNKILVGKIRGKEITVCKGDRSNVSRSKECFPTGMFQLSKGDHVDFTWGMTNLQVGSLAYTIWPS